MGDALRRLLQDQRVQRQVRDRPPHPAALLLKVLDPTDLVRLETAVRLAPAAARHLGRADLADRLCHRRSLRREDIDLSQRGGDLLSLVPPCRLCPLFSGRSKPYFDMDHFCGGDSCGGDSLVMTPLKRADITDPVTA